MPYSVPLSLSHSKVAIRSCRITNRATHKNPFCTRGTPGRVSSAVKNGSFQQRVCQNVRAASQKVGIDMDDMGIGGLELGASQIIFRQLFEKESSTYTYLLADAGSRKAVLIDPVRETVDRDLGLIRDLGLNLEFVINTHCHADHVTGTGLIKQRLPGVQSGIAAAAGAKADILYHPGDRIKVGGLELLVLATPGHTDGCLSYYTTAGGTGRVFTGDALLVRGCGRTDFQGGDPGKLYDSVHTQIFSLPDDTEVYPAHDYKGFTSSTVGEEKRLNPRLTKTKEDFSTLMNNLGLTYPKQIDVAVPLNLVCGIQSL